MPRGRPLGAVNGPFPNRLRALRQDAGLSQQDIAEVLGVTYVQVGRIERGYHKLSTDHCAKMVKLIKWMRLNYSEFYSSPSDRLRARLIYLVDRLPSKQKQSWLIEGERLLVESKQRAQVLPFRGTKQG
jgi:transcriptional regulator with XRE-family HTH domain